MKVQIRRNVFETNSSSVHSISISKEVPDISTFPKYIVLSGGEFGWEVEEYTTADEKLSYLFTALMYNDNSLELLEKIKGYLDEAGVKYELDPDYQPKADGNGKLQVDFAREWDYYIDHGSQTFEFVDDVCNDKELFYSYVFGDSSVFTGNDNGYMNEDSNRSDDEKYYHYVKDN